MLGLYCNIKETRLKEYFFIQDLPVRLYSLKEGYFFHFLT